MSMKINKLEIENVKRIKAVKVEPKANGLTIIGGNNNQGKTSHREGVRVSYGAAGSNPDVLLFSYGEIQTTYIKKTSCRNIGRFVVL